MAPSASICTRGKSNSDPTVQLDCRLSYRGSSRWMGSAYIRCHGAYGRFWMVAHYGSIGVPHDMFSGLGWIRSSSATGFAASQRKQVANMYGTFRSNQAVDGNRRHSARFGLATCAVSGSRDLESSTRRHHHRQRWLTICEPLF